jgi:hypothetical protein
MLGAWDRLNHHDDSSEGGQAKGSGTRYQVGNEAEQYTDQLSGPDVCRMLHAAANRTCWDIPQYRRSGRLNERELSLSFLAFTLWYIDSLEAHANGDDTPLNYPSDPARLAAMRVISCAADKKAVRAELRRSSSFNPVNEFQWAAEKANNSTWKECLTRAVIMGCRSMAFSVATTSGYNSTPIDETADGLALGRAIHMIPPNAIIATASVWLDQALGKSLSQQLLPL